MLRALLLVLLALIASPSYAADEQSAADALNNSGSGAGDLMVAPTRIVLEGRTRAIEIVLNNKGNKEATYRVSLTHLRQQADGSYAELTEETAKSTLKTADDLVRYSPRQVTLKPGESQIVKVMVRKQENLPDGEYTSHMLFRAVPDLATGEDVENTNAQSDKISIRLIPVYGVSIPVIVRQGTLTAQAKLLSGAASGGEVKLAISRTGNKSVFADITVLQSGTKNVAGIMRGVSILSYLDKREVSIPVTGTGPYTVELREREEEGSNLLDKIEIR